MTHLALLIFANTARREATSKAMAPYLKPDSQVRLAQAMLDHTRQLAALTRLPVIEISSDQQLGATFGERYTHAISQVFAQGYDQIISIGIDCPSLSLEDIQEAAHKLTLASGVIGLAKDGGAYLIALRKDHFDPQKFKTLPWQGAELSQALSQYFYNQEADCLLLSQEKTDVDNPQQLKQALQEIDNQHYLSQVLFYLYYQEVVQKIFIPNYFITSIPILKLARRGPPYTL